MNHRNIQVAQELLKALSKIIREEIPQEKFGLITVTDCVVTTGLEEAKVYISALINPRHAVNELKRHKKHVIDLLKNEIQLRKIPKITFHYDIRPEQAAKLETHFKEQ